MCLLPNGLSRLPLTMLYLVTADLMKGYSSLAKAGPNHRIRADPLFKQVRIGAIEVLDAISPEMSDWMTHCSSTQLLNRGAVAHHRQARAAPPAPLISAAPLARATR